MSLRGQTGDLATRCVINSGALRAVRESEQFRLLTGDQARVVNCRTTANLDVRAVQIVVAYAIAKHPRAVLLDHDWARFQQLVREWHVERGTTSSPVDMATCPAYQRILAMGKPAISLILKQLELEGDDPDHWFWALSYLTGEDPVPSDDQGNMRKMSDAWLRWGRNNLHV